jgi:hypothetical protein
VGLVSSNDPESSAGGSVATGRFSLAGQVEGYDTEKSDTLVLQVGSWRERLRNPPPKKKVFLLRNLIMDAGWKIVVREQKEFIRTEMTGKCAEKFV